MENIKVKYFKVRFILSNFNSAWDVLCGNRIVKRSENGTYRGVGFWSTSPESRVQSNIACVFLSQQAIDYLANAYGIQCIHFCGDAVTRTYQKHDGHVLGVCYSTGNATVIAPNKGRAAEILIKSADLDGVDAEVSSAKQTYYLLSDKLVFSGLQTFKVKFSSKRKYLK